MDKFVSVIIPTLNSESTIEECLRSIYSTRNAPPFEVIVVDAESTDNTIELAKKYPVKLLFSDKPQSRQRNVGINHATGDIIAFTDSDCQVNEDWLSTLSKHFDDLSVASVGGPNLTPEDGSFWAQCFGVLMESSLGSAGVRNTVKYKSVREVKHNPPVNSAIRQSVLQEVGDFPEGFAISEDVVLDAKIKRKGYKLIYDPQLVVWHHRRKTLGGFIKQLTGYGKGRASAFLKYPKSLPLTYFCAATFTLGTVLSVPLYASLHFLRPIIVGGWATYFLFILTFSTFIVVKRKRAVFVVTLPFLAIIEHFSLGLGFIIGLIHPYRQQEAEK